MNLDNVFLVFLYSDSNEHLIYKKGDKFIDLINDKEIDYLDIDRNSIRKYTNNKVIYDDWNIKRIKERVKENIDVSVPLFPSKNNIIKQYENYKNQLIDISDYSIMILKHHIYDWYDSKRDILHYYVQTDKVGTYLNLNNNHYYDIFTGEVLGEEGYHGYKIEPFLERYNQRIEDLFNGNKVLKKDLFKCAYKIMKNDIERRSKI